jgi:predicted transcriptional regulator of viral defense system
MQTVDKKILDRMYAGKRGTIRTLDSFLDLGSRGSIDMALGRLVSKGVLRRIGRGIYLYPKIHPRFGELAPTLEEVVKAIGKAQGETLQPSGAYAANLLGLSEQVPMRVVYLTAGDSKKIDIGGREIILRKSTPKNMATAGKISGLVIQAMRYLGQKNVDETMIEHLRKNLSHKQKVRLLRDIKYAPAWIADKFRLIANG